MTMMKKTTALLLALLMMVPCCVGVVAAPDFQKGWGDPDADQTVSAQDALFILKVVVGKINPSLWENSACDADCSDDVSAADALVVLRKVVGKETPLGGLQGRDFTIGSVYASKYTADTAFGRGWQQAVKAAQERYGVTISVVQLDLNSESDSLWIYDMVELPVHDARVLAKKGKLMDLSQCAVMDDITVQNGSALSCYMGDSLYGLASPAMSANPMGLAINKDLLSRYAPESFGKLEAQFKDKTWTWDTLSALIKEYHTNQPGKPVMVSNTNIIGQAIVSNAGYEVDFLPDGSGAVSSIASDEGIAALDYTKKLHDSGAFLYKADMNEAFSMFENGDIPMVVYYLNEAASAAREARFAMTAMPFPIGPEQTDYVMCTFNSSVFAVPAAVSYFGNPQAMILNALASADAKIAEGWVTAAKDLGYDALGMAVYEWAAKNTSHDFSTGPFTGAVGGPVDGSVLNPDMDPYVEIPKIKNVIQQEVDAYYGQFYQ